MIVIGLTGSIAMGKTETGHMLRRLGVPVLDADAEVHRLYARGGEAVAPVEALAGNVTRDGAIDRSALSARIAADPSLLAKIEAIVHPLVRQAQERFLAGCRARGEPVAVLDIPLLFETGRDRDVDYRIVVSAPADVQRSRALSRPGMTPGKFEAILARQMPDAEKRARADFIVDSSKGLEDAFAQVGRIIDRLKAGPARKR